MHATVGGYHVRDIEISAAIDVVEGKVGKDLSEAIWAEPNNTIKFADVPYLNVPVSRGMTHDGIGQICQHQSQKSAWPDRQYRQNSQRDGKTDVVVNFMPVGSEMATKWYVEQVLDAGCAFVNGIPVFIASSEYWSQRFAERGLPVVGDDIKSQVGATITHRVLTNLFKDRGFIWTGPTSSILAATWTFTICWSGNGWSRRRFPRRNAVTSQLPYELGAENVHVGPSDYVPWLTDRKWCHIRMEGRAFGNVPLNLELKLEVWDSPNSAGVMIDAVRCAKIGLDRGIGGPLIAPSSLFHEDAAAAVYRR
jgi:myo-inositol-1-phosphate synthase